MPYCPKCGNQFSEDDEFCMKCGFDLKSRKTELMNSSKLHEESKNINNDTITGTEENKGKLIEEMDRMKKNSTSLVYLSMILIVYAFASYIFQVTPIPLLDTISGILAIVSVGGGIYYNYKYQAIQKKLNIGSNKNIEIN